MNKFVIYTTIVNGYDQVRQPLVVDDRFDYILFSDTHTDSRIGIWQVFPIPYEGDNNMLKSRYVKVHPTKVLSQYEASLYMDANIQIATSFIYDQFINFYEKGVDWGGVKHPFRDCIYEEMLETVRLQWVHDFDIVWWYSKLLNEGYPHNNGLFENNIIFRKHSDINEKIGLDWWYTLVKYCRRDQFSLMYVLWRKEINIGSFLPPGEAAIHSKNVNYYPHNPHNRILSMGINETIRNRCWRVKQEIEMSDDLYGGHFEFICKYSHPRLVLYLWEISMLVKYGFRMVSGVMSRKVNRSFSNT